MVALPPSDNSVPTAGASVIVLRRDAVLMVLRARAPLERLWSFPGGRSEPGETPEATARRELREETGLAVGPLSEIGAFRPAPDLSPLLLTVFAARTGEGVPRAGDDAFAAEFVQFGAVLTRRITPGAAGWLTRAILALSGLAVD